MLTIWPFILLVKKKLFRAWRPPPPKRRGPPCPAPWHWHNAIELFYVFEVFTACLQIDFCGIAPLSSRIDPSPAAEHGVGILLNAIQALSQIMILMPPLLCGRLMCAPICQAVVRRAGSAIPSKLTRNCSKLRFNLSFNR